MSAFITLVRKQLVESRWFLGIVAAGLFGLSWLFFYAAGRIEAQQRQDLNVVGKVQRAGFVRMLGGRSTDFSSTSIELSFWRHPFVILMVLSWSIGRGSLAVAGEVERGTLDVIMSRPISRTTYLLSQFTVGVLGLVILGAALIAGNFAGTQYNVIDSPPGFLKLFRAAISLVALGFAVYGYALFFSSLDVVRWRANLIASTLTIAMFIAQIVANIPSLTNLAWLEHWSIFTAYDPVEAALKGENLSFNAWILGGIGLGSVCAALVAFRVRDLPSNS
ncbi:MAG: hypothetical protein NVSMB14_03330 [Isosphaeraceae bacterium]